MVKRLLRLTLGGGLALCLSTPSWAGTPGMTTPGATINVVFARDIGMDINTTSNSNPMGCGIQNWFRLQPTAPNYAALVSTVHSAFLAHKTVTFWVSACDSDGVSIILG